MRAGARRAHTTKVVLYDILNVLQTKAAEEVALLLGVNEKNVRHWRYDCIDNKGAFSESSKGKYKSYIAIDEEYHV